jgi:DnaJ-class molecular chaperone
MGRDKDYYQLLGVGRDASAEEIRKAYRRLARQYHPDVNKSSDAATRFAEVQEAYDVLSDAEKRKAYDRFGRAAVGVGQGPGGFGGWGVDFGPGGRGAADFTSFFEDIFGRAAGSPFEAAATGTRERRGAARRGAAHRGEDVRMALTVSFMTAALGGTEQVRVDTDSRAQTIDVRIPAGIASGAQLRLRGKGGAGIAGGPAGDLILDVTVGAHPYFRREGLDLLVDVPVTLAEAGLGTRVEVPLLRGTVEIRVPPGAGSGRRLRVPGRGISDASGRSGDFHAVVQVVAPGELSEAGRRALTELAGELQNPRESAPWAEDLRRRRRGS